MQYDVRLKYSVNDIYVILAVRDWAEITILSFFDEEHLDESETSMIDKFFWNEANETLESIAFPINQLENLVQKLVQRLERDEGILFVPNEIGTNQAHFPLTHYSTFGQIVTMFLNRINFSSSLPIITENEDGSFNEPLPIMLS
jgi:hypothetical protein